MVDNGRVKNLMGVINTFTMLMSAHRGEVICTVTTAKVPVVTAKVPVVTGCHGNWQHITWTTVKKPLSIYHSNIITMAYLLTFMYAHLHNFSIVKFYFQ